MRLHAASFVVLGFFLSNAVARADEGQLYTRVFKVDPITFKQGVAAAQGIDETKTKNTVDAGRPINAYFAAAGVDLSPPKVVFFNDVLGELMVRASSKDLEIVARTIEPMNQPLPQVLIEAKFVEMNAATLQGLGFSWVKPEKEFTWILTDAQFRLAAGAIKRRTGMELQSAPKVTSRSGRQAHIGPTNAAVGEVLDVIPTVSVDGYSIQMILKPTVLEFLGYDISGTGNVAKFVRQAPAPAGGTATAIRPLAHFRAREVATICNLWDGQTVVIGSMTPDPLPDSKKVRMVFITPTIINAAGKRLHTDADMPWARNSIPAQPPAATP